MSDPRQHRDLLLEHVDRAVTDVIQLADISHQGLRERRSDPRQYRDLFLERMDHAAMGVIQLADISHHGGTSLDKISFMKTTFRGKQMCLSVLILLTVLIIHVAITVTEILFLIFRSISEPHDFKNVQHHAVVTY